MVKWKGALAQLGAMPTAVAASDPEKKDSSRCKIEPPFSRGRDGGFKLDVDAWSYIQDKEQSAQGTECSEKKTTEMNRSQG